MSATRPGDRVLDRDHGVARPRPLFTAASASSKVGQATGSQVGKHLAAGEMRVGAGLALVGRRAACALRSARRALRLGRAAGVSAFGRPWELDSGASGCAPLCRRADGGRARDRREYRHRAERVSTSVTSMRMPSSSARSCSSFSRISSGEGGSDDEPLERRAAVGVDADVMVERPLAVGRGGAREVERAQPAGTAVGVPTTLTDVGVGALVLVADLGGEVAMSAALSCERARGRRATSARLAASAGRPAG